MRDSLRDIIEEVVRGLSPDQAAIFILNEDKDTSLTMSQRQEHLTGREELRLKRAEVRRQIGRETGKRQKRQRTHQLRLVTIHQKEKEHGKRTPTNLGRRCWRGHLDQEEKTER